MNFNHNKYRSNNNNKTVSKYYIYKIQDCAHKYNANWQSLVHNVIMGKHILSMVATYIGILSLKKHHYSSYNINLDPVSKKNHTSCFGFPL